jgi:hypothetical protein
MTLIQTGLYRRVHVAAGDAAHSHERFAMARHRESNSDSAMSDHAIIV